MKALFICPTYGRIPYLGRMLAGFLRQTYDDKHLVIINDDKNVELCCNWDNVTCINLNRKILLDAKRNMGACFGNYDLIFPQDDDDVVLPNRIANHVKKFQENPNINLYRNSASYMIYGNDFKIGKNAPNACSFKRSAFFKIGGYTHFERNSGGDLKFYSKMVERMHENDEKNIDYIYNWSGVNYHLSAVGKQEDKIEKIAYEQLLKLDILGKKYWIEPDYDEYFNFMRLVEMFEGEPLPIKYSNSGKIEIPKK
jgi:glycosyltransferase involved in cell wall biosynthesis